MPQVDSIYPNSPKNKTDEFFAVISETLDEENEDVSHPYAAINRFTVVKSGMMDDFMCFWRYNSTA